MPYPLLKKFTNAIVLIVLIALLELGLRSLIIYAWNYIVDVQLNCFLFGEEKLSLFKGILITYFIQFFDFIRANFKNQLNQLFNNFKE